MKKLYKLSKPGPDFFGRIKGLSLQSRLDVYKICSTEANRGRAELGFIRGWAYKALLQHHESALDHLKLLLDSKIAAAFC